MDGDKIENRRYLMVYQTTEGIDPVIRKSGCYFRSVLRVYEVLTKTVLSVSQVNDIFFLSAKVGYIGPDGWMKEEAAEGVSQIASGLTGKHCYITRVFKASEANFTISKYVLKGPHFSLEEGPLNDFFDPWSIDGSNTRKNGNLDSFRYYFGEVV